jgi:hypothetical protein
MTLTLFHSALISLSFLFPRENVYPELCITLAYMITEMVIQYRFDSTRLNLEHQVHHALVATGIFYIGCIDVAAVPLLHSALLCEISSFFLELRTIGQTNAWGTQVKTLVDVGFVTTFIYTRTYKLTLIMTSAVWMSFTAPTIVLMWLFYLLNIVWTLKIGQMVYRKLYLAELEPLYESY